MNGDRKPNPSEGAPSSRRRLLLAEDDEDIRGVFEMVLSEYFDVKSAANGREALEVASTWRPDVVLLDWTLPDLDARDVARRLRTMGADFATLPIVVVSGAATLSSLAAEIGAIPCPKPCQVDQLLRAIESALGGSPRPT